MAIQTWFKSSSSRDPERMGPDDLAAWFDLTNKYFLGSMKAYDQIALEVASMGKKVQSRLRCDIVTPDA